MSTQPRGSRAYHRNSPRGPRISPLDATSAPVDSTLSASSETLVASSLERSQHGALSHEHELTTPAIRMASRERVVPTGQSPRSQPSSGGGIFSRMFSSGRHEGKREALVTTEGSIAQTAWTSIGKGSTKKERERTLLLLQEGPRKSNKKASSASTTNANIILETKKDKATMMMKNKTIQVSSLEGIFNETVDMLDDMETRESTLRAYIELTKTQYKQIGLGLRHTIFERIRSLGCSGLTVEWLVELSNNGINLIGFEKDMDYLVADWAKLVLDEPRLEAGRVLSMVHNMISNNSSYICEDSLKIILRACSCHIIKHLDSLTGICVQVIGAAVKFSEVPSSELQPVIVATCFIMALDGTDKVNTETVRTEAWSVARGLLTSNLGHKTRKFLHEILQQNSYYDRSKNMTLFLQILRGAVLCLAKAYWGNQQIENIRSPATILPSLQIAMRADAIVCRDVLNALRRLFMKYGREMQEMSWRAVIQLLEEAVNLCKKQKRYADECQSSIYQVVDIFAQLYKDGHLSCPERYLFDVIERFGDKRSDGPTLKLIEFKISSIEVHSDGWSQELKECMEKYLTFDLSISQEQNYTRREKALTVLHEFFNSHRVLVENELVTKVVLPILTNAHREKNNRIQYHMINILFDVAKNVTLSSDAFSQTLRLIRKLFNDGLLAYEQGKDRRPSQTNVSTFAGAGALPSNDNLEIMAQQIGDMLNERWQQLNAVLLKELVDTLVEHVSRQYDLNLIGEDGGDVRVRVFDSLLSIQCCPATNRIQRFPIYDDEPVINPFVFRVGVQRRLPRGSGELSFTEIAQVVSRALRIDTWWQTIRIILQYLLHLFEATSYVKSVSKEVLDELLSSIISLFKRYIGEANETQEKVSIPEIWKYLPPVLAIILNYDLTSTQQLECCKILVDCVKLNPDGNEALIACGLAIQVVPDSMARFSQKLLSYLLRRQHHGQTLVIHMLELMSDASGVDTIHNLFQIEQFCLVADILVPCLNIKYADYVYVVSFAHRTLMRWFAKVPKELRTEITKYFEQKIQEMISPSSVPGILPSSVNKQASFDGRPISLTALSTTYSSDTPPSAGLSHRTDAEKQNILGDIQIALQQFFRLGRIESASLGSPSELEGYEEIESEHYAVGYSILTLRTLAEKSKLRQTDDDDVFSEKNGVSGQSGFHGVGDERRRYASAVQPPTRRLTMAKEEPQKARDDLAITKQRTISIASTSTVPVVTVIQLIDRHMYGRSCFLWRKLEEMPEDFLNYKLAASSFSPMALHLSALPGSIRIGIKKSSDMLATRLRNLDRLSGIELHAVGLVYMGYGQDSNAQILGNQYGSPRYESFVKTLGTAQSTDDEPGGLQSEKNGEYTYVFTDEISSIVFLIATLMPRLNSDPRCNNKKMLIANNVVCIMWNQSGKRYQIGSFCGDFIQVMIELVPVDEKSLLIEVHAKESIANCLALRRALVLQSAAPAIIRNLCVRAKLAVEAHRTESDIPYLSSAIERLRKIQALKLM